MGVLHQRQAAEDGLFAEARKGAPLLKESYLYLSGTNSF